MTMTRENWIYTGVGVLVLFILINSTKKVNLKEVKESGNEQASFDSSSLPPTLKPPYKLAEGSPIPRPIKKNFNLFSIGVKPRFDT